MPLYFAFGSNMDIAQMAARCPSTVAIGAAELPGHALCFPRFSPRRHCAVAGFCPSPGNSVWGVVYDVSEPDLRNLDAFEGFVPGRDPALNGYNRVQVDVHHRSRVISCMTYAANESAAPGLTSRHYLGQLIAGARHHGLPPHYISMLEQVAVLDPDGAS